MTARRGGCAAGGGSDDRASRAIRMASSTMRAHVRARLLLALLLGLACAMFPGRVKAHGGGIPLEFWGAFSPQETRCQRIIFEAAARCGFQIWKARAGCASARLRGQPCDTEAAEEAIRAARIHALNFVDPSCDDRTVMTLGFLGMFELHDDFDRFWADLDASLTSVVFGPALSGGQLDASARRCVAATTEAALRMFSFSYRTQQRALGRIAAKSLSPLTKRRLVQQAFERMDLAQEALARRLAARCPDEEFTRVYGRDIQTFLEAVARRADCLSGSVSVQNSFVCPPPEQVE